MDEKSPRWNQVNSMKDWVDTRTPENRGSREEMTHEEGKRDMAMGALQGLATLQENLDIEPEFDQL